MGAAGLRVTRLQGRGATSLQLSGAIDDSLDPHVFEGLRGVVVFDLAGISHITSFGLKGWLQALRQVKADAYYFVRCRPTVVAQFNMVHGFAGSGTMVTFFAPYQCTGCTRGFEILVDLRSDHAGIAALQAPDAKCPACGQLGEFDDLPESYFSYAAAAPRPQLDPAAAALLDGAAAVPLKVQKAIEGTVTVLRVSGTIEKAAGFKRVGDGLEGTVIVDLSGVLGITAQGAAGFAKLAAIRGASLYLRHMPLAIAGELARAEGCFERARVGSIDAAGWCASCTNEQTVELDAPVLARLFAGEQPAVTCPNCAGALELQASREALHAIRNLPLAAEPGELDAIEAARRAPTQDDRQVDELFGKYRLVKRLGHGGMAEVFLARQTGPMDFTRSAVLKRILPHLSSDPGFVEMFLQEARLAARLSHPNIVQIFELGFENGQYFMALEYVRGWDLNVLLGAATRIGIAMPPLVACRLIAGVCAGLHAAHTNRDEDGRPSGIVHRDVTPHNILVSTEGNVKLSDFGIAKIASAAGTTEPGIVKGKLPYIAPEAIRSPATVDPRSDIYSAGLVLYECVTFEKPFKREQDPATMQAVLTGEIPPLARARPDAPAELQAVLDRATARDPGARYATAHEMELAVEELLGASGRAITTRDVARWIDEVVQATGRIESEPTLHPVTLTPTEPPSTTDLYTKKEKI